MLNNCETESVTLGAAMLCPAVCISDVISKAEQWVQQKYQIFASK